MIAVTSGEMFMFYHPKEEYPAEYTKVKMTKNDWAFLQLNLSGGSYNDDVHVLNLSGCKFNWITTTRLFTKCLQW